MERKWANFTINADIWENLKKKKKKTLLAQTFCDMLTKLLLLKNDQITGKSHSDTYSGTFLFVLFCLFVYFLPTLTLKKKKAKRKKVPNIWISWKKKSNLLVNNLENSRLRENTHTHPTPNTPHHTHTHTPTHTPQTGTDICSWENTSNWGHTQ